jgi:dolichol-phosphate mannosyltransferase
MPVDFAVVIPMANEEPDFLPFITKLKNSINRLESGKIYFVVDKVSKDKTLELCNKLSDADTRFVTLWAPENKNIVDAYLRGYREALKNGHEIIIEMDAGLSHDPDALPMFLRVLNEGNECAFGSRFINGGSICDSTWKRTFLSKFGTISANILLGSKMYDMTSGYQGFHREIVEKFVDYKFYSSGHFYQTELRYLLRKSKFSEVPIHYRAPSPSVSKSSLKNALLSLFYYYWKRLKGSPAIIQ